MVDVVVATRKLTREQIGEIVGNNPRAIKIIEALTQDVSITLPEAIASSDSDSGNVLASHAFLPPLMMPALPAITRDSDASPIIATQIFGA